VAARRRIKRGYKSVPSLGIEREDTTIRKPLLSSVERSVEHEFADGLAFGGCGRLQGLFCGPAQPKIKLFRPIGALGHCAFLTRSISQSARQCHDKLDVLANPLNRLFLQFRSAEINLGDQTYRVKILNAGQIPMSMGIGT
jgi:hypothetical protein